MNFTTAGTKKRSWRDDMAKASSKGKRPRDDDDEDEEEDEDGGAFAALQHELAEREKLKAQRSAEGAADGREKKKRAKKEKQRKEEPVVDVGAVEEHALHG